MIEIVWDSQQQAHVLTCVVKLPAERSAVFDFFSDAFQLEQITPPWLNFRILTAAPIHIQRGTLIDYQLQLRGIPIRWRTEISLWDPPLAFIDRQLRGPYQQWEHHHSFQPVSGGTEVTDEVIYRVPGGRLANWLFVQSQLKQIFAYRRKRLLEIFSNPADVGPDSAATRQQSPADVRS